MEEQKVTLSERELEILRLVATGAPNKEIARQLVISPNTVKVHLRNIFTKIGVYSRTEATLYAIQIGLVKPGAAAEAEEELAPDPLFSQSGPARDGPVSAVFIEETLPAPHHQQGLRRLIRPWHIGLGLFFLLAVLVTSAISAGLLNRAAITPTVASQAQAGGPGIERWSQKAAMPSAREGMGYIEYNDAFYLVGGESAQGIESELLCYEPAGNTWKKLTAKPTPVTDVQAALLGEKIYVPGGRLADGSATGVLEVYDLRDDTWEARAPLPVPLSGYALASFEGQIFLFGGKTGQTYVSTVYSYDPQEDRWQERSPMDAPRAFSATAVLNGKILVLGGYDGKHALSLNQAYFPDRDADSESVWEDYQPLPDPRYGMGVTQIAGFIFIIGGTGENNSDAHAAYQYVSSSDQWALIDPPPLPTGARPALLSSGNFLFLIGGESGGSPLATHQAYQAVYTISVPMIGGGQ